MVELEEQPARAARSLARRLGEILGRRLISVQVVGRRRRPGSRAARHDLDVLVILAETSEDLETEVRRVGDAIEAEYAASLAVEVTSPRQIEVLGDKGTPVWELLESGVPILDAPPPRPALPPAPGSARAVPRKAVRRRAWTQLRAAETLLASQLPGEAVACAYQGLVTLARAWLPADQTRGRTDAEALVALVARIPGGPEGGLGRAVARVRSLRDEVELGCAEIGNPEAARGALKDARLVYLALLGSPEEPAG